VAKGNMTEKFPEKLPRATKRSRGRTPVASTPVAIRGGIAISPTVEDRVRRKLVRRIGHAAPLVERGTVRFDDINGPRGGVDTECRIKLVLSGRPSVQAQDRARNAEAAFDAASFKLQRALASVRGKHASRRPHSRRRGPPERAPMKIKTARRPPSRRAVKAKARRAKHRLGMQGGRRR
jgi:ribosome-associated translation inhibitor RaiA